MVSFVGTINFNEQIISYWVNKKLKFNLVKYVRSFLPLFKSKMSILISLFQKYVCDFEESILKETKCSEN